MPCNAHHHPSPQLCHLPKQKLCPIKHTACGETTLSSGRSGVPRPWTHPETGVTEMAHDVLPLTAYQESLTHTPHSSHWRRPSDFNSHRPVMMSKGRRPHALTHLGNTTFPPHYAAERMPPFPVHLSYH